MIMYRFVISSQTPEETKEISKSERIPLAGSYGLLLLNCNLLLLSEIITTKLQGKGI